MDNRRSMFQPRIPCSNERSTPRPARDLRRRRRRRPSRLRAFGASAPGAERPGDLPCRRQGSGRDGRGSGAALSRCPRTGPGPPLGERDHAPPPWRADAADQVDRSRPSRARRGRTEGRGGKFAACAGRRCQRSAAGAVVGRRLRELDRAGRRRLVRAETTGDAGAVTLGRAARRGQHRSPAFVADQGRPARAGRPAEIVTLAISDVPRDDPSAIASGPTVPDPTTLADARAIVAKYGLAVDDAIRRALDDANNESCKPGDPAFARAQFELIARPKASLDAAIRVARDAGYEIVDLGADLEGEARSVAADHAQLALQARAKGKRVAILSGGELTVTVRGNGRGGPHQEYALALAGLLRTRPGIAALAADPDAAAGGAGSAADPAGAMIDQNTFAKM